MPPVPSTKPGLQTHFPFFIDAWGRCGWHSPPSQTQSPTSGCVASQFLCEPIGHCFGPPAVTAINFVIGSSGIPSMTAHSLRFFSGFLLAFLFSGFLLAFLFTGFLVSASLPFSSSSRTQKRFFRDRWLCQSLRLRRHDLSSDVHLAQELLALRLLQTGKHLEGVA